ncbi:MAG TPA: GAF domain-containing protein [Candidatus Limnocylindria bacterium]|jgi:diguanylate cyclase (GGDEF)-like protein|nr:GAF domain-containing protein [Candidatus Limnocylindria bacterium]
MRPIPARAYVFVAVTCIVAAPFIALGLQDVLGDEPPAPVAFFIWALAVLLSLRPIRIAPNVELSASEVAVLAGVVLLPPGELALVAAVARLVNDLATRKSFVRILRNAAAQAISAGAAAMVFQLVIQSMVDMAIGPVGELIVAGAVAAFALVVLDLGQILALQLILGTERLNRGTMGWIGRTGRAQLLWGLAAVITVEVVLIQPWFLLPGIPLFLLGYLDIRARFIAERRARLLATLVEVGHAVGSSLDPNEVFRSVYRQVAAVMDADNFFVATLGPDGSTVRYRFLMDGGRELEPVERPREGTLVGATIDHGPLLLRDVERDSRRIGLPDLESWGAVEEHSIIVAPLRQRDTFVGAISAQSRRPSAYDDGDLQLLAAIANEASIALERATLYDRTATLSRRLFELHRLGLEISEKTELVDVTKLLAQSVVELLKPAVSAVYLDKGGDSLEFAYSTGSPTSDVLALPKTAPLVAKALESGQAITLERRADAPEFTRKLLERFGHEAVLVHPLRSADQNVGVLFVTWREPHMLTDEERELIGILAGVSASTMRSIRLYRELDDAYLSTVSTLMSTIVARDHYREDHQRKIAADAVAVGERLRLSENELRDLRYASLFHSLGKIGVPAAILSKAGPLTPEEKKIMQEHPILGARILESIRFLRGVVPIVRHAYERWDGSGYPDALAGEQIPVTARILAVAIAFESMLAERPYRPARREDQALAEIKGFSGTYYDPTVVNAFVSMVEARGVIQAAEVEVASTSRELSILSELTPEFHTILDLQQLLDRTLGILERAVPGASLTILLHDQQTDELVSRAVAGAWTTVDSPSRMPTDRGISGWVFTHREGQIVDDVRADPRYVGDPRVRSELVVPLISRGQAVGVLVQSHPAVAAFSKRDLTLMETVGAQIAAQIEVAELHERLKRAANTDALTGIHNYRYFYDRLEEEIARAERHQSPLAVAFFDIDELKKINDTYGHLAGNEVLRMLGQTITERVRTEDVPARYGGDEFAIVMPDTPREEAEGVVVRLMEILDGTDVKLPGGGSIKMPARSWGVSSYPMDGRTAEALVENADTRAYARKRGR